MFQMFRINSPSLQALHFAQGAAIHRGKAGSSWPNTSRHRDNKYLFSVKTAALYSLCLLFLYSLSAFALPEDSKEKMTIQADYSIYNFKTGLSTYKGHVKVDQGTTHLTADLLTTKSHHRQIQEATAYGQKQPAHYWTLPKPDDAIVNATAEVIHFYPSQSLVRLEKNVIIQQGENHLQGQLVLYDSKNQTITAPSFKNTQAVLVYQSRGESN